MLELRDLRVHFDISKRGKGKTVVMAVNGVSLTIDKGDALGLVGESGSGKTTVGKAALHLVPITGGRFLIDGEDMTRLDRATERKLRRKAQIVFQDPHSSLNPRMTIYRSVAEPLILHTKVRGAAMRKRVSELLEVVGLPGQFLYRYPARAVGRAEAAGVHRPGARIESGAFDPRRAHFRARRLRPIARSSNS